MNLHKYAEEIVESMKKIDWQFAVRCKEIIDKRRTTDEEQKRSYSIVMNMLMDGVSKDIIEKVLLSSAEESYPSIQQLCTSVCANSLGGGYCSINAEKECKEGGGFELWRSRKGESE